MSRRCATKPRQGTGSPTSIGDPVHEKATASTVAPTSVHSGCPLRRAGPPRTLQASVAERHVETEVIHCVGGVISSLLVNGLNASEMAPEVTDIDHGTMCHLASVLTNIWRSFSRTKPGHHTMRGGTHLRRSAGTMIT